MNYNELNAEIVRNGYTIPRIADAIGIGKKSMYSKMRGITQFKQCEIKMLKVFLNLSDKKVNQIFFDSGVS